VIVSELSRRRKLATLTRELRGPLSVLEVGTGDGWFAARLRAAGHRVTTLDLKPPADIVADIRHVPGDLGKFDVVVALEVIEHVECFASLVDLTEVGGLIFVSTPHPSWDWFLWLLERLRLTQPRTSPHSHLTDVSTSPDPRARVRWASRPGWVHQVSLFERVA
jgi:2-polyprenyl-3-methyl-5-hydroxy-6-metoxy-1,4-benzoquinol methylase